MTVTTKEDETVTTAYVASFTEAWTKTRHEEMRKETLETLEKIIRGANHILLCGDFHCNEVG